MEPEALNELALFAGAGGGILGGKLLGWRCVCAVEVEPAARRMLAARQDDGCLDPFPIWDDVRTFDGKPWRGVVDIISGGFPCQDISAAGKGAGIEGERSGLWGEMARIIREVGPRYVLVENSPVLTSRGLGVVLGDLAAMGYDARWGVLGAVHAGAPHKRERIWIVAYAASERSEQAAQRQEPAKPGSVVGGASPRGHATMANSSCGRCGGSEGREDEQPGRAEAVSASEAVADAEGSRLEGHRNGAAVEDSGPRQGHAGTTCGEGNAWWLVEPDVGRVAHGVAARVDRLRALGNGQVPAVVALAWETLRPTRDDLQ